MYESSVQSYNNFAGADMVVTISDVVFGEVQAITYQVKREIAGLYTMGSANPRGFAKNKRFIQGSMVFLVFDKDALLSAVKSSGTIKDAMNSKLGRTAKGNISDYGAQTNVAEWSKATSSGFSGKKEDLYTKLTVENIRYADQIPPFTITISMMNEYGAGADMALYGVQIVNEGSGVSIDDLVSEKAVSFLATDIRVIGNNDTKKS